VVGYILIALSAGIVIGFILSGLLVASADDGDEAYQAGWEDGFKCGKESQ
jgi:hypothetical protein